MHIIETHCMCDNERKVSAINHVALSLECENRSINVSVECHFLRVTEKARLFNKAYTDSFSLEESAHNLMQLIDKWFNLSMVRTITSTNSFLLL